MKLDEQLFIDHEAGNNQSTLRIYAWNPPCISVGYSQDMEKSVELYKLFEKGWEIVKRPTGGGIVFHNQSEVTYSVITDLDNIGGGLISSYMKISEAVVCGLNKIGVKAEIRKQKAESREPRADLCFSYPAEYEIVVKDRKLVGSAQKRGKKTLLQQGSIFVKHDFDDVLELLKNPIDRDFYAKRAISIGEILGRTVSFDEIAEALKNGFKEKLNCAF